MTRAARTTMTALAGALLAALAATACGTQNEQSSACDLLTREIVEQQVGRAGDAARLERERSESLDQSVCRYSAPGVNVGLNVDSAPEARRRYFNRVTEALQFSPNTPRRRPRPVQGLGDDDALGPAGAYWIPAYGQLFVLRGPRQFVYQFAMRAAGPARERAAAVRLAAATLPGDRVARRTTDVKQRSAGPELTLAAPRDGEVVGSRSVVVRGTVSDPVVAVRVQGRRAPVSDGTFAGRVALRRGTTRIRVVASTGSGERIARAVAVRRGRSPAARGAAFARRRPGRMPDLLAAPLPEARAVLRGAGIPYRLVRLADAPLPDRAWAVCATTPAPDARLPPRGRVLLKVDAADVFRTSGTACARD
jgi:hypothetical protein